MNYTIVPLDDVTYFVKNMYMTSFLFSLSTMYLLLNAKLCTDTQLSETDVQFIEKGEKEETSLLIRNYCISEIARFFIHILSIIYNNHEEVFFFHAAYKQTKFCELKWYILKSVKNENPVLSSKNSSLHQATPMISG